MKTIYTFLTFTLFLFSGALVNGQSAEESAIKTAVNAAATLSGTHALSEVAAAHWILDEKSVIYSSFTDGSFKELNVAEIKASTSAPADAPATVQVTNHLIVVSGNSASVTFDVARNGTGGQKEYSHQMAFLEKKDGNWKFHLLTIHRYLP